MIINKRFFEGRTQMEVADEIGISLAPINERLQDIYDLSDILEYCNQINEKIYSDATLMNIEVIEGITFSEWLFESENDDVHQLFLELYNNIQYDKTKFDKKINISFYTMKGYDVDSKELYQNDLFSNEIERFLYSYE